MDDDIRIDVAEALGSSKAYLATLGALIAVLVNKGALNDSDAATISGEAKLRLDAIKMSDDARTMADAALKGLTTGWTKNITRN